MYLLSKSSFLLHFHAHITLWCTTSYFILPFHNRSCMLLVLSQFEARRLSKEELLTRPALHLFSLLHSFTYLVVFFLPPFSSLPLFFSATGLCSRSRRTDFEFEVLRFNFAGKRACHVLGLTASLFLVYRVVRKQRNAWVSNLRPRHGLSLVLFSWA